MRVGTGRLWREEALRVSGPRRKRLGDCSVSLDALRVLKLRQVGDFTCEGPGSLSRAASLPSAIVAVLDRLTAEPDSSEHVSCDDGPERTPERVWAALAHGPSPASEPMVSADRTMRLARVYAAYADRLQVIGASQGPLCRPE